MDESTFREIGRTVLASLFFSGLSTTAVLILGQHWNWIELDIRGLLSQSDYSSQLRHDRLRGILVEFGLASTLAVIWHLILASLAGGAHIRQRSSWTTVFRRECPQGHQVFARVRMADDIVYYGRVAHFTANLDVDGRELVLAKPLYSKTGTSEMAKVPDRFQRVILRGDAINVISVEYFREPPTEKKDVPSDPPQEHGTVNGGEST